jgi:hypothetical protein
MYASAFGPIGYIHTVTNCKARYFIIYAFSVVSPGYLLISIHVICMQDLFVFDMHNASVLFAFYECTVCTLQGGTSLHVFTVSLAFR